MKWMIGTGLSLFVALGACEPAPQPCPPCEEAEPKQQPAGARAEPEPAPPPPQPAALTALVSATVLVQVGQDSTQRLAVAVDIGQDSEPHHPTSAICSRMVTAIRRARRGASPTWLAASRSSRTRSAGR